MTATLALSLGGWSPDRQAQESAVRQALGDPDGGAAALAALGAPEPERGARHLANLAVTAPPQRLDELVGLLAVSPDPSAAARALDALFASAEEAAELSPSALAAFVSLASQSPFFGRFLSHHHDALVELAGSGALAEGHAPEEFSAAAARLLERHEATLPASEEAFALALRHQRNTELARIFYREVQGLATVDVTGREVSNLAGALLDVAYRAARRLAAIESDDEGLEALEMSIIGLGKLGARELNFSSDVDLLFVAGDAVVSAPHLARFGERVAQRTRELIDRPLAGSRVFRVDLRLRPDGSRGPLLGFPRGLRDYYERLARTWERAALLRARVVAGDPGPGADALALLEPIRHPRVVDPSAVDDLRAMKDRIDRHDSWRTQTRRLATGWDSKVGQGGIREVEFVVAAFQYLLAGREPQLRGLSTYEGLGRLAAMGLLDPGDAQDLDEAYRFYRQLEHRLQMDEDRQTQRVPTDPMERHRLARRLGFVDWEALDARLERYRGRVREVFERTLASQPSARPRRKADEALDGLAAFMNGQAEETEVVGLMERLGFARPRSALGALRVLFKQTGGPMSAQVLESADRMPATLLDAVLVAPDPDAAMSHLTDLLIHPHASAVLGYLRAKPASLRSVMTLLGASDFLARRLTRSPWWVDRLLGSGTRVLASRAHLAEGWARMRPRAPQLEARLNLLRRFHIAQIVRIAMAYLEGAVDDVTAAEQLTVLAEFALGEVVTEACTDLAERGPFDDLVVIGMGRLGSREMGFGSDLDLVFVFGGAPEAAPRYARLARRLIHFLDIPMPDGVLYHCDLRLRPWGNDGTVVTTLERFGEYYAERADPWERIALVRGRPVVGPEPLAERFAEVRRRVCSLAPDETASFVTRLDQVRDRLLHEVARPRPGRYHLKYGAGGLMEIELLAQIHRALAMQRGGDEVVEPSTRILDTLSWLAATGTLETTEANVLSEAYAFYRRLQNVLRLTLDRSVDHVEPAEPALRRARQLLGRQRAELADPVELEAEIRRHVASVRPIYRRHVAELTGRAPEGTP